MHFLPQKYLVPIIFLVCSGLSRAAGPFSEIVVFGDSLSDAGNIYHDSGRIHPVAPYFDGRYSDGPVWPAYLADILDVPRPLASQLGGMNFAYGGAETGQGTTEADWFTLPAGGHVEIPRLGKQVADYLARAPHMGEGQLYALWGGSNDFPKSDSTVSEVVNNLLSHVEILQQAGAQNFLLLTLPFEEFNETQRDFNQAYLNAIAALKETIPANIFVADHNLMMSPVIDSHLDYGIVSQWRTAMNENGEVVHNPGQYFWWDEFYHPTTRYHRILASKIAQILVPDLDTTYVGGWRTVARQIHANSVNLAREGIATQSSDRHERTGASNAIDGSISTANAITDGGDPDPYWQVTFGESQEVTSIEIYSSHETSLLGDRGFQCELLGVDGGVVWARQFTDERFDFPLSITTGDVVPATSVRLSKLAPIDINSGFNLAEVEVYGTASTPADLRLTGTDTLHFEIDGGQADFLDVSGELVLGGSTLQLEFIQEAVEAGDVYHLFHAHRATGEFGHIELPELDAGLSWDVSRIYDEGTIAVVFVTPGDLNSDGVVDAADAGIVLGNWGTSETGDLNGDGIVDAADVGIMFAAWTGDSVAAVPEPFTAAVPLTGILGFLLSRTRRRI